MENEKVNKIDNEEIKIDLLKTLLKKKDIILKKYRKKFEELKFNQLKNSLINSKDKYE